MYNRFLRFLLSFCLLVVGFSSRAQETVAADKPEMADVMRSNGKIYVVVGCVLIVLAGLFLYLFSTDRRLRALEEKQPPGGK